MSPLYCVRIRTPYHTAYLLLSTGESAKNESLVCVNIMEQSLIHTGIKSMKPIISPMGYYKLRTSASVSVGSR